MRKRLAELDFPDRMAGRLPVWASQVLFALACTALCFGVREMVDIVFPGAGPFALTFPFVLAAALFARWQAGALAMILSAFYAWYFVLPVPGSFHFLVDSEAPRVLVNLVSGFAVVALAELFRRAVRHAVGERDIQLSERDLYLSEFDHRVRNNFATVTSLLDMQRRQMEAGPAQDALFEALGRVASISRAHRALYRGDGSPDRVEMSDYMVELCEALREGLLEGRGVALECKVEPMRLDRDRAVALGLLVNELVTNAAKHAFTGRDGGKVGVGLTRTEEMLFLVVQDDGIGMPETLPSPSRLGQRLIKAFAAQAGGAVVMHSTPQGSRFTCSLERRDEE